MGENDRKSDDFHFRVKKENWQDRQFHVISSVGENSADDPDCKSNSPVGDKSNNFSGYVKEAGVLSPEEEDGDDAFFTKSFTVNTEKHEASRFNDTFAGGLRSLFDSEEDYETSENEDDENNLPEEETLSHELEAERRESLDGILYQDDADFLTEAGLKYDSPQTVEGVFVQKSSLDIIQNLKTEAEKVQDDSGSRAKIRPESILEAMLFVGDRDNRPLSLKTACSLMRNVSEMEAIEVLADLNERYHREGAPYKIVRCNGGYRMVLRTEYIEFVSRFSGKIKEFKLSQTAIDVLALIAYRQPIAFEEILEVRNNAGSVLNQLVKRDLITQEKQLIDKKKVTFYKTTERFLKLFNLASLDDLPIVGDIDYR